MKHSDALIKEVKKSFKNGMTIDQAMARYGISKYFAQIWKNEVFDGHGSKVDIMKKYQFLVDNAEKEAEIELGIVMQPEEANAISDETWERMSKAMKKVMFRLAGEIEKAK